MLAQAIGRWGNFMNHEAYGGIVADSFYDHFPAFIKDNMYIDGHYRQPTFLFESIGNLIGFFLISFVYKKLQGVKKRRRYGMGLSNMVWLWCVSLWKACVQIL